MSYKSLDKLFVPIIGTETLIGFVAIRTMDKAGNGFPTALVFSVVFIITLTLMMYFQRLVIRDASEEFR